MCRRIFGCGVKVLSIWKYYSGEHVNGVELNMKGCQSCIASSAIFCIKQVNITIVTEVGEHLGGLMISRVPDEPLGHLKACMRLDDAHES